VRRGLLAAPRRTAIVGTIRIVPVGA